MANAISAHHGGYNKVRKRLGYKIGKRPNSYWKKWENVKLELQRVMTEKFKGSFPSAKILETSGHNDLRVAIIRHHGGFNAVRKRMGFELDQKPKGYWKKWEIIRDQLQRLIIEEFNNSFPTMMMLRETGHVDLLSGIQKHHGGLTNVRTRMGYKLDNWKKRAVYYLKRGYSTEVLVKDILEEWADLYGFRYSEKAQTKVGSGRYLEMVCGENKIYGIDITNSKTKGGVEKKWKTQKYHELVDELWVIVVSNKFRKEQFNKWNRNSPNNILIIDYRKLEEFLNNFTNDEIPFEIPPEKRRKLEALALCTYKNKDKLKEKFKKGRDLNPQKTLQ